MDIFSPGDALRQQRLEALRQTWVYARQRSPYYQRNLPDLAAPTLKNLRELPVFRKEDLALRCDEIRCGRALPAYMIFTGGTTGLPQVIYGSEEDLLPTHEFVPPSGPGSQLRPLRLTITGGHHGNIPQVPGRFGCIQIPLRNEKNFRWAWEMLSKEHDFEGYERKIAVMMIPLPAVKRLGHFFLEQGYDLSRLSLEYIGTFAWYLSRPWRTWIERVFSATVVDHFGFTEIKSALARECLSCGLYHYGREVIWEAVDPETGRPVEQGIGKLLVTSLYPYAHDHLLFRYESGDLVEVGPFCEAFGDFGFRPSGRIAQSFAIVDGGRQVWALVPSQIQELVDRHHWIARLSDIRFSGITRSDDDAFPKWRVQRFEVEGQPVMQVDVEMKSSPVLFREEWENFRRDLYDGLMAVNPDLYRLVGEGKLDLRIEGHPPGALAASEVFIC